MTATTVGILGGGQLARMLALAGAPLGLRFLVLDTAADACAGQFVPQLTADYRDLDALAAFAGRIDVATFDFENVPADSAGWLASQVPVFPAPRALALAQDRLAEKQLFGELGIPVAPYAAVATRDALEAAAGEIGLPAVLKTRRLGYDGKGQFRLREPGDIAAGWDALGGHEHGLILESWVPFDRELSIIAARSEAGEFVCWPVTENWHVDGILSASLAPAPVTDALARLAVEHASRIAETLGYVGVFALELFQVGDALLANEMAPRVHNSGHWTIEGAECSQFENHLRAVLGLPLGSTQARGVSCMLNWVGALPESAAVLSEPGGHWHDYGKQAREGRKVGHATFRAESAEALSAALDRVAAALGRQAQVAPVIARLAG
ncbi:MAG: 5-(carboxyamino)imidazole ribonucleotide synthase [Xanthomonadaceae bacterium]|nr:5-(carboxyamino)imidazole ribonucleotide synthase [Xanthomonadaceae bacterium]